MESIWLWNLSLGEGLIIFIRFWMEGSGKINSEEH